MKRALPPSMRFYAGFSRLMNPFVHVMLLRRRKRGKEDLLRSAERKGVASIERPEGVLIWLHGASVGEIISLLPIAEHFCAKGQNILVTSGTVTSAEIAARRMPKSAIHQYIPVDLPAYVNRFLEHWKPDIGIFAESELWPNLIHSAQARGAHLVIVNARMSERSFKRWQKFPAFIEALLNRFELVLAQTQEDGVRLQKLGAPRVLSVGNLKYDVEAPPVDQANLALMKQAIEGRAVLVAASTHLGEEEMLVEMHRSARAQLPHLLTIIVPRHPERGSEISEAIFKSGLSTCRRSEGTLPDQHTDIYVADTIGEMGLFYRISQLTYMGGSLVPRGGQNPIEPVKLGNAILHGPHIHNFTEVYEMLTQSGGALQILDVASLTNAVTRLFQDRTMLSRMSMAAARGVQDMAGANQRTLDAIDPLLLQVHLERNG
jgi:3-deoxy-D-manno-octulosonic-acid transferase